MKCLWCNRYSSAVYLTDKQMELEVKVPFLLCIRGIRGRGREFQCGRTRALNKRLRGLRVTVECQINSIKRRYELCLRWG